MEYPKDFLNKVIQGDCLEVMKEIPDNSVDSIITDPPYELGFMGKSWDNTGIANKKEMWAECLRVLKPGGHLLAFSGTRTYHRMAVAIEDAGFEVRDMIEWVYGSGFPKSLNIAKKLDKMEGVEHPKNTPISDNGSMSGANYTRNKMDVQSELAKQWEGWGTALKPAHEPICMARKPLAEKTVAENVLKYGTGGINIDESRVETSEETRRAKGGWPDNGYVGGEYDNEKYDAFKSRENNGRFPANLIHDNSEEVKECFPETKSQGHWSKTKTTGFGEFGNGSSEYLGVGEKDKEGGNASRFFKSIIYQAKASKSERNKGCEGLEEKDATKMDGGTFESASTTATERTAKNNHPTVKPVALMEYLIKMVTPKGGIVLDPFAGSGTTLISSKENGFQYIGIELTPEYIPIIEARLKSVTPKLL